MYEPVGSGCDPGMNQSGQGCDPGMAKVRKLCFTIPVALLHNVLVLLTQYNHVWKTN